MGLRSPGPAEVIRSSQRDKEFILQLKQDIDEMILEVFGQRVWIRCQEYSGYISGIIYYTLTNFSGFQTLGEEYVGVIQVVSSGKSIPSRKALSLMIFAQVLGTPFVNFLIRIIENFHSRQSDITKSSNLPKYLVQMLDVCLQTSKLFLRFQPLMKQLHLALFYMDGRFLDFSKRLAGIHYILIRHYFGNNDAVTKRNLRYLMWLSIINLSVCSIHDTYKYLSSHVQKPASLEVTNILKEEKDAPHINTSASFDADPLKQCSLCLDVRRHTSLTPCGHAFCWGCIIDWMRTEGGCPICRELIVPSRIVPLQNFY